MLPEISARQIDLPLLPELFATGYNIGDQIVKRAELAAGPTVQIIATLIFYDAEFPETARYVAMSGAELNSVPTALGDQWDWVSKTMIPTRAYENGIFLAYANSAGTENGLHFLGHSFIAAPDGKELARASRDPAIIYEAIEPELVAAAQSRLPYLDDLKALKTGIK
ncbi:MAG: nitrilase-related carbon-nitrogen hydrolase [Roseobacter sp.]